ncbi:MAG: hypothetical protein QME68_07450, partial [Elusimicrobiota bacterium]|nr:hypothetical protein [Elusimicrobiota bacterium]
MVIDNIFLPVKIDWHDVEGWKSGWLKDEKKVVQKCQTGNKRCIGNYPNNLSNCQKECRNTCYGEMRDKEPPIENLSQYREAYYNCLNNCETNCENNNTISTASCTAPCPSPDKCYPESEFIKSYVIKIEGEMRDCQTGATTSEYTETLDKSEWVQPCSCFFKPNRTYNWSIKACCASDETNCGTETKRTFKTNAAPEPLFPYDLDWNGA